MQPQLLFPILSAIFLLLAAARIIRDKGVQPASKTWLLLAVLFGVVSAWLHLH